MNTVLVICLMVVTASFVVAVVYLVQTMSSIKKAADELEILLKCINREVGMVAGITSEIRDFVTNLTSPWAKAGGWLAGLISAFIRNKREEQQQL
jgi:uncharacterized protein YoxC